MTQQLLNELQSDTQLQVHDPLVQDLRGSIKLEELRKIASRGLENRDPY